MTTPNDDMLIGPARRPSDGELAVQPTVKIPWQRPAPQGGRPAAPLLVAALINTLWATLVCVVAVSVLVILGRVTIGQRPTGAEALLSLAGWLLAHGIPVKFGATELSLAPLSLTLLAVWRLNRAGVHTSRGIGARRTGSMPDALRVAGSVGLFYGLFGLVAAFGLDRAGLGVSWWRAGLQLLAIGFLAALLGSIRITGALRTIARATPLVIRDAVRTAAVSALFLLGAGAGVIGLSVALHGDLAARALHQIPSGFAGEASLTVVCLAFAPNFAVWASAYLLGPGFLLRGGALVAPGEVTTDTIPQRTLEQMPVFAGLPDSPLTGALWAMLALPVLAGIGSGLLLVRRRLRPRVTRSGDTVLPVPRWHRMVFSCALAGPLGGLLLGAAVFVAGGRLDDGDSLLGPVWWQASASSAMALGLGAMAGVAVAYLFLGRKRRWSAPAGRST